MAMGADAKQSGSSGSEAICWGQFKIKKRKLLGLTLLSALEVSVDMGRCPAALRRMGAAALGIWCHLFLQGAFNDDFKDGHISEDIAAMICSRHLLEMLNRH